MVTYQPALPCSNAQEGMWLMENAYDLSTAYVVETRFAILGPLDRPALERAVAAVGARHDALRTTFRSDGTALVHVVAPPSGEVLTTVGTAEELCWVPADLATGPLFQARLYQVADQHHLLWLGIHHIICDGASVSTVLDEISAAYQRLVRGDAPDLGPPPYPYARYCAEDRAAGRSAQTAEVMAQMQTELAGVATPCLSARTRDPGLDFAGGAASLLTGALRPASVSAFARSCRMSDFAVLLTAFGVTVGRLSGTERFVLATPISRRDRPEFASMVGLVLSTVPMVVDLTGNPTVDEVLRRTKAAVLAAVRRRTVPFHVLASRLGASGTSTQPVFDVMFGIEALTGRLRLPGARVERLPERVTRAPFGLDVLVEPAGDRFRLSGTYATRYMAESDLTRLLSAFEHVTGEIVTGSPERRMADLTLPGEPQARRRVLSPGPPPPVEAAAMSRATRLADLVGQAGAARRVGLLVGADDDTVVGLLGIWLSGRDCVLLDPADEPGRLVWAADRAGLSLVVAPPSLLLTAEWLELDVVGLPQVAAPAGAIPPAVRYGGLIAFASESDREIPLVFGPRAVLAHAAAPGGAPGVSSPVHMRALSALAAADCRPPSGSTAPLVFPEAGCVLGQSPRSGAVTTDVLDRYGKPAAAGVAGELVLLGPGLADGYLDLPRLTADRFAPCAFGERGARMYRTGLPARTDADGALELLG